MRCEQLPDPLGDGADRGLDRPGRTGSETETSAETFLIDVAGPDRAIAELTRTSPPVPRRTGSAVRLSAWPCGECWTCSSANSCPGSA